jgi:hypothetical protein
LRPARRLRPDMPPEFSCDVPQLRQTYAVPLHRKAEPYLEFRVGGLAHAIEDLENEPQTVLKRPAVGLDRRHWSSAPAHLSAKTV